MLTGPARVRGRHGLRHAGRDPRRASPTGRALPAAARRGSGGCSRAVSTRTRTGACATSATRGWSSRPPTISRSCRRRRLALRRAGPPGPRRAPPAWRRSRWRFPRPTPYRTRPRRSGSPCRRPRFPPQRHLHQFGPTLSPDGRQLAFAAVRGGTSMIWVRSLDSLDAQPLPGTEDATYPFWSPDSRRIGFFVANTLKTIDIAGGPASSLCETAAFPAGAAWSRHDVIVFARGRPVQGAGPGRRAVSLARRRRPGPCSGVPPRRAALRLLDHPVRGRLDGIARFGPAGPTAGVGLAGDLRRRIAPLRATGHPPRAAVRRRAREVDRRGGARGRAGDHQPAPVGRLLRLEDGDARYRTGTLAVPTQLTWVDRHGKPLGTVGRPGRHLNPVLSPDGDARGGGDDATSATARRTSG